MGASLYRLNVPSAFGGRADLMRTLGTSFLRECWQLSPFWEVGLKLERLELAPGMTQVFPSAQWPAPPYWRQSLIPSY